MVSDKHDLRSLAKAFALRVIRLYSSLSLETPDQILGKQALRSGTSVGAHYREALRARSRAEFISKIEVALQELEETSYWFELLVEAQIVSTNKLSSLMAEADELTRIMVTSIRTAKRGSNGPKAAKTTPPAQQAAER